jgi:hypothetical protein
MTDANMAAHAESPWMDFWRDLKVGYDAFEASRLPPRIGICGQRYVVAKTTPGMRNDGPLQRIEPGKPAAAGFDTSRCGIPVAQPAEVTATASASGDGSAAIGTHFTPSAARTVARIERREQAGPPPPSRAERTDYGWVEREPKPSEIRTDRPASPKVRKQADERQRMREKRRAHREALKDSYLRSLVGVSQ